MSELKIKLENLQCTLTDPVSAEDIHAAWFMVGEIIPEVAQLEAENERFRELLSKHHEMDESRTWFWDDDIVKALGGE